MKSEIFEEEEEDNIKTEEYTNNDDLAVLSKVKNVKHRKVSNFPETKKTTSTLSISSSSRNEMNLSGSKLDPLDFHSTLLSQKIDYKPIVEEKLKIIEDYENLIFQQVSKIVVCTTCKRKFANKAHYIRHTTLSELHKKNSGK